MQSLDRKGRIGEHKGYVGHSELVSASVDFAVDALEIIFQARGKGRLASAQPEEEGGRRGKPTLARTDSGFARRSDSNLSGFEMRVEEENRVGPETAAQGSGVPMPSKGRSEGGRKQDGELKSQEREKDFDLVDLSASFRRGSLEHSQSQPAQGSSSGKENFGLCVHPRAGVREFLKKQRGEEWAKLLFEAPISIDVWLVQRSMSDSTTPSAFPGGGPEAIAFSSSEHCECLEELVDAPGWKMDLVETWELQLGQVDRLSAGHDISRRAVLEIIRRMATSLRALFAMLRVQPAYSALRPGPGQSSKVLVCLLRTGGRGQDSAAGLLSAEAGTDEVVRQSLLNLSSPWGHVRLETSFKTELPHQPGSVRNPPVAPKVSTGASPYGYGFGTVGGIRLDEAYQSRASGPLEQPFERPKPKKDIDVSGHRASQDVQWTPSRSSQNHWSPGGGSRTFRSSHTEGDLDMVACFPGDKEGPSRGFDLIDGMDKSSAGKTQEELGVASSVKDKSFRQQKSLDISESGFSGALKFLESPCVNPGEFQFSDSDVSSSGFWRRREEHQSSSPRDDPFWAEQGQDVEGAMADLLWFFKRKDLEPELMTRARIEWGLARLRRARESEKERKEPPMCLTPK